MLEKLKKITDEINNSLLFPLLLPLYFIGLGLSKLLRSIFAQNEESAGWKDAQRLNKNIRYYKEML